MRDPKTIEETVARALAQQDVELVDLIIQNQGRKKLLQFFVDKTGGVTLDDCGELTDKIDSILEMENLIDGAYILEVSSPGVQRVLKSPNTLNASWANGPKLCLKFRWKAAAVLRALSPRWKTITLCLMTEPTSSASRTTISRRPIWTRSLNFNPAAVLNRAKRRLSKWKEVQKI